MKTIYKVKVTIQLGEIDSTSYTVVDTVDNGIEDGQEIEILFDTLAEYFASRYDSEKNSRPPSLDLSKNFCYRDETNLNDAD
jgi:hypothetical protein